MRTTFTAMMLLISIFFYHNGKAQTTYTISTNTTYTATTGSAGWCGTCTFNIAAGKTLTMDMNATCGTCTFNTGNIAITTGFSCQSCAFNNNTITMASQTLSLQSSTNTFVGVNFTVSGSGSVSANAPVSITNSTFKFSGTASFLNNNGLFNATNSKLYFAGNSYFSSSAGPMNLISNSVLIAGDGTLASSAYVNINTASPVNIYDNSYIGVANNNNYYFNWSAYHSISNSTTYSTAVNSLNCGGGHPNACSAPYLYGCATLSSSGAVACATLALTAPDLSAQPAGAGAVALSWQAAEDGSTDHYTIERSANGYDWTSLATITAVAYNNTYHFIDPAAPSGTVFYRLVLLNKDGRQFYSGITTVTVTPAATRISIYPNPVTGRSFFLQSASTGAIVVNAYTLSGQLLFVSSLKGQTQYTVKLPLSVTPNSYIVVQAISQEGTRTFNLLVQ